MLISIYEGGPSFPRTVIVIGTGYNKLTQIELYPIKVKVHVGDISEEPTTYQFSRNLTLDQTMLSICRELKKASNNCRLWVKVPSGEEQQSEEDNASTEEPLQKVRKLTYEKTDVDGEWQFVRNSQGVSLSDLEQQRHVELLLEVRRDYYSDWPRDQVLQRWRDHLRVGDMVDAVDHLGDWYESVITFIGTEGDPLAVGVHFLSWGADRFDTVLAGSVLGERLQPLYSRTPNWRDTDLTEVGKEVEFTERLNVKKGSKWLVATVATIDLPNGTVRVKYRSASHGGTVLSDDISVTSEQICRRGMHIKLEPKKTVPTSTYTGSHGSSYSGAGGSSYTYSGYGAASSSYYSRGHHKGTPEHPGVVGLSNIGNTCFMNSMLQCLSNTHSVTHGVFLSDRYASELNTDNPLGHEGKVAMAYAKLMKDLWSGKYVSLVPDDFKRTIGDFAPQFAGFQQQDSQEFMLFLLDGLHEDLNRIHKKPHVEKIESDGREDDIIARESWRRFLLRNDSAMVDNCFGQLKSHVTCTNCGYESVTFDEYSSLSLPIPTSKKMLSVVVTVYPLPLGSVPVTVTVSVEMGARLADLRGAVVAACRDRLLACVRPSAGRSEGNNDKINRGGSGSGNGDYVMVTSDTDEFRNDLEELSSTSGNESEGVLVEPPPPYEEGSQGSEPMHTSPPPPPSPAQEAAAAAEDIYLHTVQAGGTSSSAPRIYKTYEDNASVRDIVRGLDGIIMYQLQHDAPTYSSSSYSSGYSSYYSMGIKKKEEETPQHAFVDVLFAAKSKRSSSYYYSSSANIDLIATPHRLSYVRNQTTVREVLTQIWHMMRGYLSEDSTYLQVGGAGTQLPDTTEDLPYDISITNSFGSTSKGPYNLRGKEDKNAEGGDRPFTIGPYDVLACVWKEAALEGDHLDRSRVDAMEFDAATAAANARKEAKKNKARAMGNSYSSRYDDSDEDEDDAGRKAACSIYECLDKFVEREAMPPTETWYCRKCKQHLAPIKKFDIWSVPDVLIIHLKRFQYTPGAYFVHRDKINDLVDFPVESLDLSRYVRGGTDVAAPPVYDLQGVSEHMGGMGGGHYTATCKNPLNGKWYGFNDSHVSESGATQAVSSKAYVLFYKRRSGSLRWGGVEPLEEEIPSLQSDD